MARKTLPLTDTQIKAANSKDKDYYLFEQRYVSFNQNE